MPETTPALTRRELVAWRNGVFAVFLLSGVGAASWIARVPSVRDTLGATPGEIGLLLFGIAAGSIAGLLASGHLVARFGARAMMLVLPVGALGVVAAAIAVEAGQPALAFAGLAVWGAGLGICDVAMNVSGAANERLLRRSIMPLFHAFFSFGTMAGAGLAALLEAAGVSLTAHMTAVAVTLVVGTLLAVRVTQSESSASVSHPESARRRDWRQRLGVWTQSSTLLIGVIVLGMAFAEGSANDWLALAMVDGHGADNPTGAAVFGVFVTAMTVGRVVGVRVLDRFGRVPVLRASAGLAAVGLLLFILVPNPVVAVAGVILWGLGSALGFPVGMSAAADDPVDSAARVSTVATIGYIAFLVGPPLIGFLGDHVGILNALLVVLALVVASGAVSQAARERRPGT